MDTLHTTVSIAESRLFHRIDRDLYTILVKDLFRDPSESMQIMGFWLYLERAGITQVVSKVLKLPEFLINELANEAMACFKCMNYQLIGEAEIPLTQTIVNTDISLEYFQAGGPTLSNRILELVIRQCVPVLADIMENALNGVFLCTPPPSQVSTPSSQGGSVVQFFSGLSIEGEPNSSRPGLIKTTEVSRHERTMFVTFSKGYPVDENEVREFFDTRFGQCLESFHMQEVTDGEQALYARMVFKRSYHVTVILQGDNTAKFTINGKHVWMRKFMSRATRLFP